MRNLDAALPYLSLSVLQKCTLMLRGREHFTRSFAQRCDLFLGINTSLHSKVPGKVSGEEINRKTHVFT